MNLRSLIDKITKKLGFHNSRAETFKDMVLSLIDQNNVQHHALARMLPPKSTLKSKLERIRRFF
jgi:hypothetical protein